MPQGRIGSRRRPRPTARGAALAVLALVGIVQSGQTHQIYHTAPSPQSNWTDCSACHRLDPALNHPVDMHPACAVPEWLPLDDRGRMTCVTCHEPVPPTHVNGGATIDAMLRAPTESLCTACHDPFGSTRFDLHGSATGRAHLELVREADFGLELDGETVTCLSCHDGSVASDPWSEPRSGPSFLSGHPIGMAYRDESDLRPRTTVDPRIRLFDDRIGCGSCHSVFADTAYLLTVSNQRSALCRACHLQ